MTGIKVQRAGMPDPDLIVDQILELEKRRVQFRFLAAHEFPLRGELSLVAKEADRWVGRTHVARWANLLEPGEGPVDAHGHGKKDTVVYYPLAHDVPLVVFETGEDDLEFAPERDTMIYMPAGTEHAVALNDTEQPRYSVVFLYARF